jgi:hypothetical protein
MPRHLPARSWDCLLLAPPAQRLNAAYRTQCPRGSRVRPALPLRHRRTPPPLAAAGAPAAMGVGGLIPLFGDLMGRLDLLSSNGNTKQNLYALCKGKVVGVDGNCLLHRLASIPSIAHPVIFGGDYSEAASLFCLWCQQMVDGGISLRTGAHPFPPPSREAVLAASGT